LLSKKTVMILGAGASAPYGFSTGKSQLDTARLLSPQQIATEIAPYPAPLAPTLHAALRNTGERSIDAMLPKDSPILGPAKALIARDLFRVERNNLNPKAEPLGYWYRTLYSNIPRRTLEEVRGAPLRIFTFNDDRSLDDFLWRALSQTFSDASPSDIAAVLGEIGPFHLHGQLGRLKGELTCPGDVVAYGGDAESGGATDSDVAAAVTQIRLISETSADDALFKRAREALAWADRVIFLGFSFHPDNLGKFQLQSCLRASTESWASAFGITEQEMGYLRQKYSLGVQCGQEQWDVARFFAVYPQMLD
jgi:hypothetical protein